jgi:hypothetical protein
MELPPKYVSADLLSLSFAENGGQDEFQDLVASLSLTAPLPPSTTARKAPRSGATMADNYDVENQGRPESAPAATTCLIEKPDIDKKVKVSCPLAPRT